VATDKRERQRAARLEKTVAEVSAAKRAKARGTAVRIVVAAVVVLAVVFGVSQLMGDDSDSETTADDTEATDDSAPEVTEPPEPEYANPELAEEVLARTPPEPEPPAEDTAADAVEITTLTEGEGEGAVEGDTVTVHYVGVLADGTEFDQSWERGQTFPVSPLGQAAVIDGWNEGLIGAKIGERRRLVLGSDKAYGEQGSPPAIPADAPLAFEIDIVDIQAGTG
jgi:FKBP-type peptidyl-prolyl cis-trans isomerase